MATFTFKHDGVKHSHCCFNVLTLVSWILFSLFLLFQPYLANWTNNAWMDYNAVRSVYDVDTEGTINVTDGHFKVHKYKTKYGICTTPLSDMICTDGQNFTELALKYRPNHPYGCGCGEGILGETLCPRTSYGHTLSDYVSTAPALGAMLGLSTLPLMGGRMLCDGLIMRHQTVDRFSMVLYGSLNVFQISYAAWGIASVCVFPLAHALLTVLFLGSYIVYVLAILYIFHQQEKKLDLEQKVIIACAIVSFLAIVLGSIPRAFLMIDKQIGEPVFPNWNTGGFGSYAFWLGEAVGLSIFFGLYPMVHLAKMIEKEATWYWTPLAGESENYTPLPGQTSGELALMGTSPYPSS